jgi:DMSO/TMAO reductase YedYZ heme-binding membrane subunit
MIIVFAILAFIYIILLFAICASTASLVEQINGNTINLTTLKALPICNYLMLGGASVLIIGFVSLLVIKPREIPHSTKSAKLIIGLGVLLVFWALAVLCSNAVFYEQVQDSTINTSLKEFIYVANIITACIAAAPLAVAQAAGSFDVSNGYMK